MVSNLLTGRAEVGGGGDGGDEKKKKTTENGKISPPWTEQDYYLQLPQWLTVLGPKWLSFQNDRVTMSHTVHPWALQLPPPAVMRQSGPVLNKECNMFASEVLLQQHARKSALLESLHVDKWAVV